VSLPEEVKEFLEGDFPGIVPDFNDFGVPGVAGGNLLVRGIFDMSPGVTGADCSNPSRVS